MNSIKELISLVLIIAMALVPGVAHVLGPLNALLAGNLCAAALLLVWHHPSLIMQPGSS